MEKVPKNLPLNICRPDEYKNQSRENRFNKMRNIGNREFLMAQHWGAHKWKWGSNKWKWVIGVRSIGGWINVYFHYCIYQKLKHIYKSLSRGEAFRTKSSQEKQYDCLGKISESLCTYHNLKQSQDKIKYQSSQNYEWW